MFSRENCLPPWLGGRSIEVGRLWNWICHHKATSVAAYMFATCWFISFVFIFIYIYISGTLPKGPTCFLGTYLRSSRLLRRRWPTWTKRLPHAARRLRRPASNVPVFLAVWGGITTRVINSVSLLSFPRQIIQSLYRRKVHVTTVCLCMVS